MRPEKLVICQELKLGEYQSVVMTTCLWVSYKVFLTLLWNHFLFCYRLNICGSSKFLCWSCNPQNDDIWKVINVREVMRAGPTWGLWCPDKERHQRACLLSLDARESGKGHVSTQWARGPGQTRVTALIRTWPYWHNDRRLPAPRTGRKYHSVVFWNGSPSWLMQ